MLHAIKIACIQNETIVDEANLSISVFKIIQSGTNAIELTMAREHVVVHCNA